MKGLFIKLFELIFGSKVGSTRIIPMSTKILFVFVIFILVSNFTTNYFNLHYNRFIMTKLLKELLVKDLKEIYTICNNEYEMYKYSKDVKNSYFTIMKYSDTMLQQSATSNSVIFAFDKENKILLQSSRFLTKVKDDAYHKDYDNRMKFYIDNTNFIGFEKAKNYKNLLDSNGVLKQEGSLVFKHRGLSYFSVYKYHTKWGLYILRGEEINEFQEESRQTFRLVSTIIIVLTFVCSIIGLLAMQQLLKFISYITRALMEMNTKQQLSSINLHNAPADQISYLGVSFNALSDTIGNLLNIFKKFVSEDLAQQIYLERNIKLTGEKKNLTMLFTDIKGFTFITETLGTDIIQLLNIYYERAIDGIVEHRGIVGSIIGDALLAVYGTFMDEKINKSYQALHSAYKIIDSSLSIRAEMGERKDILEQEKGILSDLETKIYQAVLIDVGVGLDSGEVFYGNIGSYMQMTNTVIGDRVNSAARLEGLTRIYKVPVICSEFFKMDIESNVQDHNVEFVELDQVQVKGKTEGVKIYWPIFKQHVRADLKTKINRYIKALRHYYVGEWPEARKIFATVDLPMAQEFMNRTQTKCPENWSGIWAMKEK